MEEKNQPVRIHHFRHYAYVVYRKFAGGKSEWLLYLLQLVEGTRAVTPSIMHFNLNNIFLNLKAQNSISSTKGHTFVNNKPQIQKGKISGGRRPVIKFDKGICSNFTPVLCCGRARPRRTLIRLRPRRSPPPPPPPPRCECARAACAFFIMLSVCMPQNASPCDLCAFNGRFDHRWWPVSMRRQPTSSCGISCAHRPLLVLARRIMSGVSPCGNIGSFKVQHALSSEIAQHSIRMTRE